MGGHDSRHGHPARPTTSDQQESHEEDGNREDRSDPWTTPTRPSRRSRRRSRLVSALLVALFATVAATIDLSTAVSSRPIPGSTAVPDGTTSSPGPSVPAPVPAATVPVPPVSDAVAALGPSVMLDGTQYRVQTPGRPWSIRASPSSNYSRFELRAGDRWPNDVANFPDGRQRTMIRTETRYDPLADLWISFSFRWSGQISWEWGSMMSLHSDHEASENAPKPGPFGISLAGGRLSLVTRADPRATTTARLDGIERFSMPHPSAGEWHDVVLRMRLDPWGNGRLTFWLDGVQRYDSGAIPVGYNDQGGPYAKFGLYRGVSDLRTVMEFANIEVATQSLQARVSSPRPIPRG
jgi:hypothetical protein